MKGFRDKVAVITGASAGIGFGIAERCVQEGMKVVLAGINRENLIQAEKQLKPIGATTLCVQTDVSKPQDIEALADTTLDTFGAVHLLVNNADRKGSHIIFDENGHLWLIDHGLCFNIEEKLRTVLWDFAGDPVPDKLRASLKGFREQLDPTAELHTELSKHLAPDEVDVLARRADSLLEMGYFPFPPNNRRAYPFPPV